MRKISVHFIIFVLFFSCQNNLFSQDGGNKIINLNNKSAIDASLLSEKIVDVSHLSKLAGLGLFAKSNQKRKATRRVAFCIIKCS